MDLSFGISFNHATHLHEESGMAVKSGKDHVKSGTADAETVRVVSDRDGLLTEREISAC